MGAPYGSVDRKCEDVFADMIDAMRGTELAAATVVRGFAIAELTGDRIEVVAESCEPVYPGEIDTFTGNWRVKMLVSLVTNYRDHSRSERTAMEAELFDMIMDSGVVDLLNNQFNAPDFRIFGGQNGQGESITYALLESTIDEHELRSDLRFEVYCAPSTEGWQE